MSIGALTLMTLTGGLILLKLAVMAMALILLAKAMQHASHPGSMDPAVADVTLHEQPHIQLPGT
jgi:hypothetical protein